MTPEKLTRIIATIEDDIANGYPAPARTAQYMTLARTVATTLAAEIVTHRHLAEIAQAAIDGDGDDYAAKAARDLAELMIGDGDDAIMAALLALAAEPEPGAVAGTGGG